MSRCLPGMTSMHRVAGQPDKAGSSGVFQLYTGTSGDTTNSVSGGGSATLAATIASNPLEYGVEVSNSSDVAQGRSAPWAVRPAGRTH
jgi:hypothetical protein